MRNKISYIAFSKSVVDEVTSNVVMYADDINPDVLIQVCQMYNTKATINAIQSALDRDNRCTGEEGEQIVEALEKYVEAQHGIPEDMDRDAPMTPVEVAETLTAIVQETKKQPDMAAEEKGDVMTGTYANPVPVEKKKRTVAPVRTGGKVQSSEDVVKQLKGQQEKLQRQVSMVEWVDNTTVPSEFPDGLHTEAIQLLVKYTREIAKIKAEFIQQIQAL